MGIDPRPLTVRQVVALATGRRLAEWSRTCYLISWVVRASGGPTIDPDAINPFARLTKRDAPRRSGAKTLAMIEAENRASWRALDRMFRG